MLFTPTYSCDNLNRIRHTYEYDNYGNRTKKDVTTYTYINVNKLRYVDTNGARTAEYDYDCFGNRRKKIVNGVDTKFYYENGKLLGEDRTDSKRLRYYYDNEGVCGFRYYNGSSWKRYTYVKDTMGSVIMIKNDAGLPLVRYLYDSYGKATMTTLSTEAGDIGTINPIRWKSHYYDVETGLYYVDGRYYDKDEGLYLDGLDIITAIEELVLDRNGILCDNILQL